MEAKWVAPTAHPPPSANSPTPRFKTNSSGPNPNHAPAQQIPTSPAARDVVLGVIAELHAQGHLAGLEIPVAELSEECAPALFKHVVAAYMAETGGPRTAMVYPVPPPPIASGQNVDLLRLYLAVRSRGGFKTVAKSKSSEAVAMDINLDVSARPEIELMYAEYIAHWEILIRGPEVDQKMVDICNNEDGSLDPNKDDKIVPLTIDAPPAPPAGQQNRKRGALVDTLNWLRTVAKNQDEPGILRANSGGHVSRAVKLRHQMCANIDCRPWMSWKTLTGMFEWVCSVASRPNEPGVVGEDFGKHFATAVQVRRRMFASDLETRRCFKVATKYGRRGPAHVAKGGKQEGQ